AQAALLESSTYRGGYPERRPQPQLDPTVKRVLAVVGGLAIAGALWLTLSALTGGESEESPDAAVAEGAASEKDTRVALARAKMEAEAWEQAITHLDALRSEFPDDPTIRDLLGLARRESSARDSLEKGRRALDKRRYQAGIKHLMEIPRDSSYAPIAEAELQRAERLYVSPKLERARTLLVKGEAREALDKVLGPLLTVWPGHAEATELRDRAAEVLEAERAAEPEDAPPPADPPPRPTRPRPRRSPPRASSGPSAADRAMVTQARDAFEEGKIDSALTAAETAADLGVTQGETVAEQIRKFQRSVREGDRSKEVARALGSYTDALFLAEQITPGGGAPAIGLRPKLAQLHYISALKERKAGKLPNARRHLTKALGYDPNHQKSRDLLGQL
ncbi:MAG: hypothetical protein P1V51_25295, partial [Deltaproteobacteria bacterium]|nr:hypothetical protein [Deltaproteobacteria bacterium]